MKLQASNYFWKEEKAITRTNVEQTLGVASFIVPEKNGKQN